MGREVLLSPPHNVRVMGNASILLTQAGGHSSPLQPLLDTQRASLR